MAPGNGRRPSECAKSSASDDDLKPDSMDISKALKPLSRFFSRSIDGERYGVLAVIRVNGQHHCNDVCGAEGSLFLESAPSLESLRNAASKREG